MLESEPFEEPCLAGEGRDRQKGDVDFLCIGQLGTVLLDCCLERCHRTPLILHSRQV